MSNILYANHNDSHVLKFVGDVRVTLGPTLSNFLKTMSRNSDGRSIIIDLTETTSIDSTALGFLAKISLHFQKFQGSKPTIISTNPEITRILLNMGFDSIFIISESVILQCSDLAELPTQGASEPELREQVLDAHRTLMKLNGKNKACFMNLVEALECEKQNEKLNEEKKETKSDKSRTTNAIRKAS
ncbi:MAG: anti-sigma factor antagonist [Pseudomonadales bacterium]|nr:anti-sigma factor antagonist [Pseudomonadales bacterium]